MGIAETVVAWLAQEGPGIYLVGGCVRDRLLGRPLYDLDLVVAENGLTLARRIADRFGGAYYPLDQERGTGRAVLHEEGGTPLVVDVAQFRGVDLAADLADRDFAINALAADVRAPDQIIDIHSGVQDLAARCIRPVSPSSIRNDPLRALRAVRLAAQLGFRLAPETVQQIRQDGVGLVDVSNERVRDEVARLLSQPRAAAFLRLIDEMGLLTAILPELEPLRGLAQPPPHHLDALAHSLETVAALEQLLDRLTKGRGAGEVRKERGGNAAQPGAAVAALLPFVGRLQAHLARREGGERSRLVTLKLAALLHDVGKPARYSQDPEGRIRFLGHDAAGVAIAGQVLRRLRLNNAEVQLGETIVRHHMRPLLLAGKGDASTRAIYRFFRDTRAGGVEVLLHALADHEATCSAQAGVECGLALAGLVGRMLADYWERSQECISPPILIDGHDLLRQFGLQPGPQIGDLLEAVREAQASGEVQTRDEALALAAARLRGGDC